MFHPVAIEALETLMLTASSSIAIGENLANISEPQVRHWEQQDPLISFIY